MPFQSNKELQEMVMPSKKIQVYHWSRHPLLCLIATLSFVALWLLGPGVSPLQARDQTSVFKPLDERVEARAALMVDAATGEVLFERNSNTPYPPASILKLLTALMVYERTKLQGNVTVELIDTRVEPSSIPLRAGETVPVSVLVQSLLIASDNDSGMALARYVAGSVPEFAKQMNERARQLGCTGSFFVNPHGLPAKDQVVTAADMMKIFRAVLAIPQLKEIMRQPSITLTTAVGTLTHKNHNKLLGKYAGMGPAKTGWTASSRHTYAASVTRDGHELLLILLRSANKWQDATALFDYGFTELSERAKNPPVPAPTIPVPSPDPTPIITAGTSITAVKPGPRTTMKPQTIAVADTSTAKARIMTYRVAKGDTLTGIGKKYDITIRDILEHNPIQDAHRIQPGMILYLPVATQ